MGRSAGVNLKKTLIESLEPKDATYPVPDSRVRGLAIQVTPRGTKSFVLRYRLHGHQKTLTLGRFPELTVENARKQAEEAVGRIRKGEDPTGERRADRLAISVSELADRFIEEHIRINNKPSWQKEATRLIEKVIKPQIGKLRAKDIGTAQIAELLFKLRKETPVQVNRVRSVLGVMFKKAELWGIRELGSNPVRGQDRAPEVKKDRHLSDAEYIALGSALTSESQESMYVLAAIRLLLLTGCRKSELLGDVYKGIPALKWDQVDLDAGVIRIGEHKTSKKSGVRIIHLCSAARDLLASIPQSFGNPHVIPGEVSGQALVNYTKPWTRVKRAVAKAQAERPAGERQDIMNVTVHDLRRSFASVGARLGYPELFVAALLGHAAGTVTQGYARVGGNPLEEAVETIGGRIAALLAGEVDLAAETRESRLNRKGAS